MVHASKLINRVKENKKKERRKKIKRRKGDENDGLPCFDENDEFMKVFCKIASGEVHRRRKRSSGRTRMREGEVFRVFMEKSGVIREPQGSLRANARK